MTYRRVLMLAEVGADLGAELGAVRALAGGAERLVVAAIAGAPGDPADSARGGAAAAWVEAVRGAAGEAAERAEVHVVEGGTVAEIAPLLEGGGADLVVTGPRPPAALATAAALRRRDGVAVLWLPASAVARGRALRQVLCLAVGDDARRAGAVFLRDHGDPATSFAVLAVPRPSQDELAAGIHVAGIRVPLAILAPPRAPPWRAFDELVRQRGTDLVVLTRLVVPFLRRAPWTAPVLILPAVAAPAAVPERPLDVADAVDLGDVVRLRLGVVGAVGRNPPVVDEEVAFVSGGRLVATRRTLGGEAELPSALVAGGIGIFRVGGIAVDEPLAAVERMVAVVRPGARPLVLFDAELPAAELRVLARERDADLLAVRMRPVRGVQRVRARLREAGLPQRVVDAHAVLGEGDASDVGDALDAVRLARVATRMAEAGFPVAAIVHRGSAPASAGGYAVLRAGELGREAWRRPAAGPRPASLADRLDSRTGVARVGGNRVALELDNATARRWLLDAIASAERTVHLQTYMATDDAVGREVEAALGAAAARGVAVRVLVDSLRGLHGSLGLRNPLLERLSERAGVEVRVALPVSGLPSLEDLKRRDHRKLLVADGRLALLGGRNVAHEYYRGFDEVAIRPSTPWREVPWLDAGARVEGPVVAALERSYRDAWIEAGGASFEVAEPGSAGSAHARLVVHHGLRDAAALETYLTIIDGARSSVDVVTGFPLLLEVQHALVRALRRGVRVRTLFGHVTPTHGGEPFEGEWAAARTAATWMVHARMDALVAAGAEAYDFELRDVPGWAPDLGPVHPHVHAKALTADGSVCAVGSANLDLTGSYWESELLLVVEDDAVVRGFERRVDALMAGSVRVDREDPSWQRLARRREWLRHWPGVLSP